MKREIIDREELSCRLGAGVPLVILDRELSIDRIVCETIDDRDLIPGMRRTTCYVMHPETYHRAIRDAEHRWGASASWQPTPSRRDFQGYSIPIQSPPFSPLTAEYSPAETCSMVEWRITP